MDTRKWSSSQLQSYYMQEVLQDVKAMSLKAIVWEEVFNNWKSHDKGSTGLFDSLDKEHKDFPIVQMWKEYDASCVKAVSNFLYIKGGLSREIQSGVTNNTIDKMINVVLHCWG